MSIHVFLGPSMPVGDARALLGDAVYLPPVAQGDVYRIALRRPTAIAIVDGYFERVPSVWHKEILWTMRQSIPVVGCASIGALRAVELHPFGMVGVGRIFEDFRSGRLQADDEVALAHGPAETGYRNVSEALVNIRATLGAARRDGVIDMPTARELLQVARRRFYPDRVWPAILDEAGIDAATREALIAWLPEGRVDLKRKDTEAMLRGLADATLLADWSPPEFELERTVFWQALMTEASAFSEVSPGSELLTAGLVLDEARLLPELWRRTLESALRHAGPAFSSWLYVPVDEAARARAERELREARGLLDDAALAAWMEDHALDAQGLARLVRAEVQFLEAGRAADTALRPALFDALRDSGDYARLGRRALDKQRLLAEHGIPHPTLEDAGVSRDSLVAAFAASVGRRAVSDETTFAHALGFPDADHLVRALVREHCYQRLQKPGASQRQEAGSGGGGSVGLAR
jgi:hypothetical protein